VAHAGVKIGPSGGPFAPCIKPFHIHLPLEARIEERVLGHSVKIGLHFQLLDEVVVPGQPASEGRDAPDPTVNGSTSSTLASKGIQSGFGHGVHTTDGQ
jgi:hypothetical protein